MNKLRTALLSALIALGLSSSATARLPQTPTDIITYQQELKQESYKIKKEVEECIVKIEEELAGEALRISQRLDDFYEVVHFSQMTDYDTFIHTIKASFPYLEKIEPRLEDKINTLLTYCSKVKEDISNSNLAENVKKELTKKIDTKINIIKNIYVDQIKQIFALLYEESFNETIKSKGHEEYRRLIQEKILSIRTEIEGEFSHIV